MSTVRERPLRIALLTDVFPPLAGGSGWSTFYLGKALQRLGHDVTVLRPAVRSEEPATYIYQSLPVRIVAPGPATRIHLPVSVARRLAQSRAERALSSAAVRLGERIKFDVYHGQHLVSGLAAVKAAKRSLTTAISVVTVRDYWPLCPESTRLTGASGVECKECFRMPAYISSVFRERGVASVPIAVLKWLDTRRQATILDKASAVVAVSRYVESELRQSRRLKNTSIVSIPNLIDPESVARAVLTPWPLHDISPEQSFLFFAGKLETNKGAALLPEIVASSGLRIPLVIAGSGKLEDNLAREARERGLDFRFESWLNNDSVLRLMRAATAVIFPSSWQEPLSRVLLEACAAGAAVAAMDTGGTTDIITDEVNGLLARDVDGLAEAIRRIAQDLDLSSALRTGAVKVAHERFSGEKVTPLTVELYFSLLEREAASANR